MEKRIEGKSIVIVGAGDSGLAVALLCLKKGAKLIRVLDKNPDVLMRDKVKDLIKEGVEVLVGEHKKSQFKDIDLVVLSPGVPKEEINSFVLNKVPIISELELGFWFLSEPVIAVTGTNGKTTTTSLIAHVLSKKFKIFLGGNIGIPLSFYVVDEKKAEIVVVETSSFQLQNIVHFRPHVAIFLNFSPNHLDFHKYETEYLSAKLNIFKNQQEEDYAIVERSLVKRISSLVKLRSKLIPFDSGKFECPSLLGEHNKKNIEAAYICCSLFGINEDEFNNALSTYSPYPHRLQIFYEKGDILFVDDSKATTLAAMESAIKSFFKPIILLAGGKFKGGDPESVKDTLKRKVKGIIAFGECGRLFYESWRDVCHVILKPTLNEAVEEVVNIVEPGDVVLLSPATSSFDEFENYKQRGLFFQKKIMELMGR